MHRILAGLLAGAALCTIEVGTITPATAQDNTVESVQKQSFPAQPQVEGETKVIEGTVPPPPHAQPEAPLADLAKPAAVGPAQANTSGTIATDGPPGATRQTMPSTISQENAALDKLPIGARQLPLTAESRQLIAQNMQALPDTAGNSGFGALDVTAFLPTDVPIHSFPADVVRQVPETGRYKYVKRDGVVLIIDPPYMTVVGEIHL